ncbi:hypothetical protein BASA81_002710 [Batrachochytrium salamandrivorans]|nr:hypothetical protein BASA81_002710 [Batrachochytrium salamandrivorans]
MQVTLRVRLTRAEGLPSADKNGLSDPYCVLYLDGEQKQKSQVIYKTLNPEWHEDVFFVEKVGKPAKMLQVEVWDKDPMSSDKLGVGEVDLSNVDGSPKEFEIQLSHSKYPKNGRVFLSLDRTQEAGSEMIAKRRESEAKSTGGLGVGAMFSAVKSKTARVLKPKLPDGGKGSKRLIVVDVIKARGVPPMDADTNSADPYCILKLGKKKHSTRIKFRTLAPEWKERFAFSVFDMGGRDSSVLEFSLWDHDTMGMDDKIGTLKVDLAQLPLGLTDERFWKVTKHEPKFGVFGFKTKKPTAAVGELPDVELLLLITVTDLFEPALDPDQLVVAQKLSKGWLKTNVHRAVDLGAFDANGKSDPFVVVEVGNKHMRTPTIKANLNPEWECTLEMPVMEVFDCVFVKVFDEDDNGKFEHMGSLAIPLLQIENGKRRWYQLKDESLLHPAEGCIQLSFHLNYLKLPMLAKCIGRRQIDYMAKEPEFKFGVLKSHIARLSALAAAGLQGVIFANKLMTWQLGPPATIGFAVGWTLFWYFIQLWQLTFVGLLTVLFLGMVKFRGKSAKGFNGEGEEGEGEEEEEDAEEEPEKEVEKPPKAGLVTQMRQMKAMSKTVQNLLGELVSTGERVNNLFQWESPHLTAVVCLGLFVGTLVLIVIPFRYLALAAGLFRVGLKGLKKYHPKFKRGPYHIPYQPVVVFIGRVPDNRQLEQQRVLDLPPNLPQ